jgi:hypothetical protein
LASEALGVAAIPRGTRENHCKDEKNAGLHFTYCTYIIGTITPCSCGLCVFTSCLLRPILRISDDSTAPAAHPWIRVLTLFHVSLTQACGNEL